MDTPIRIDQRASQSESDPLMTDLFGQEDLFARETRAWDHLSETERLLWQSVDDAIFGAGTSRQERLEMLERSKPTLTEPANLGLHIKALRRKIGLTPTVAARQAGVPSSKWCNWEGNAEIPDLDELARIAQVLHDSGESHHLLHLQRRAPLHHLRQFFIKSGERKVARGHGEATEEEALQLKIEGLDPKVRRAFETWCTENQLNLTDEVVRIGQLEAAERHQIIQEIWGVMAWDDTASESN